MPLFETAVALTAAHLLADFIFQPTTLLTAKRDTVWGLPAHVAIVLLLSVLLVGNVSWHMLFVLGFSHLALDAFKVFALPTLTSTFDGPWAFSLDQLAHFVFIGLVAVHEPNLFTEGWWHSQLPVTPVANTVHWYLTALVVLCGLILCIPAGGLLIGKITQRMLEDVPEHDTQVGDILRGLPGGGRYIGWLERLLVMLFILGANPQGIGFLIATKSILRFGDIKNWHQRAATEYVIIGTFLSFSWAIIIASATHKTLAHWLPAHP